MPSQQRTQRRTLDQLLADTKNNPAELHRLLTLNQSRTEHIGAARNLPLPTRTDKDGTAWGQLPEDDSMYDDLSTLDTEIMANMTGF